MDNVKTDRKDIFSEDVSQLNAFKIYGKERVENPAAVIEAEASLNGEAKAKAFSKEIAENKIADFEKDGIDKMCHVSTFCYVGGNIYMSYYANTQSAEEDPGYQAARLAYITAFTVYLILKREVLGIYALTDLRLRIRLTISAPAVCKTRLP